MQLRYTGERFMPGWGGPAIHLEHLHRYSLAAAIVNGTVLDLGCGVGYGSRLLASAARRVVGIDGSTPTVDFARHELAEPNVEYLVGDARGLPFPSGTFDWVVCFELIEHLGEGEGVVAEIARVLAPGGQLLLSTPNRPVYSDARGYSNPFHVREFNVEELQELLAPHFGDVALFGQRLVAGSVVWDFSREMSTRRLETCQPEPALAQGLVDDDRPIYLLALCGRERGQRRHPACESVMTGRLEAFGEEQSALRIEAEAAIHAEYEPVVERLVAQLGEFDERIRQLGGEIEAGYAVRQTEAAGLIGELAEQRSQRETLEVKVAELGEQIAGFQAQTAVAEARGAALEESRRALESQLSALQGDLLAGEQSRRALESRLSALQGDLLAGERAQQALEAEVRRLEQQGAERERQALELGLTLERTQADLYWCYGQWQERKSEVEAIKRSKMWRLWMAYQALRRAVLSPFELARRMARSSVHRLRLVPRALARVLGWLHLAIWTAGAWLSASWQGRGLPARTDSPGAPAPASLRRRPRILMVCPYPLYPADHGGGVRIYNLVRRLAEHCDLHLLIFIQADDDPDQRQALEPLVEKLYFHHWRPSLRPDRWGLQPPGAQLFDAPEVRSLINEILSREKIDILQLEYTELGQYGLPRYARVKVVLSEIDITFRSRARRRRAGMHRRYTLDRIFGYSLADWMRQFRYELRVTRRADQVHVMSEVDGAYLARFLPGGARKIRVVPNAVDLEEYRPPAGPRGRWLLFVGNFDHLPNLDALDFLLGDLWPRIRQRVPDAELLVVGARAGESVRRYDGRDGVSVVGAVPATRPYYQQCRALVAPIRAGSGTRLKILEALACGAPVATTTIGAEGIDGSPGEHFLIADTPEEMIEAVCRLLTDDELCDRLERAGRHLAESLYGWEQSAAAALAGYAALLNGSPEPIQEVPSGESEVDISVVIPTLNGGAVFESCLAAIRQQQTERSFEIVCVDSGSSAADLAAMERHGARVIRIDRSQFNHGLTRDLGAAESRGRVLVFINQDAVPCDPDWLENITAPLFAANGCAAVQGGILEVPDDTQRFYWHSCGDRFYFTRESRRWMERYFGIGFSTVNAAIRRDVWERHPFGYAPIMEDKKWQREVVEAGYGIAVAPRAAVFHTHNYGMKSLLRRCESEGFGWRTLGETYSLSDMLKDLALPRIYAELLRGLARGQIRSWAELLFPLLRPFQLFRGNHWSKTSRA
ncbi:MAG TPA: glycosyltransferase [Thermoanaerobaculia bacterium]|nr:glycosyltransferase [Thermoanaerobaculia bacterium]